MDHGVYCLKKSGRSNWILFFSDFVRGPPSPLSVQGLLVFQETLMAGTKKEEATTDHSGRMHEEEDEEEDITRTEKQGRKPAVSRAKLFIVNPSFFSWCWSSFSICKYRASMRRWGWAGSIDKVSLSKCAGIELHRRLDLTANLGNQIYTKQKACKFFSIH